MMHELPKISVIIPCYNEVRYVSALVENLLAQDYPKDKVEVIFADGMSNDGTREILAEVSSRQKNFRVIDNPRRFVPSGLNHAIEESTGELIIRMDAHSVYPQDYWKVLATKIQEHNAENVGGMWDTQPGNDSDEARAIVLATTHPLGIGNAGYRLGGDADRSVDTVPFGCFHRDLFRRIGMFDEDLLRNQDDEFNGRIIKSGGKIVLIPSLKIKYFARESLRKISKMFYQYGLFKPLVNVKLGTPATLRQFAPPLLVLSLILLLFFSVFSTWFLILFLVESLLYMLAVIWVSGRLSAGGGIGLFFYTAMAFPVIHFSYGIGYIFGLYRYTLMQSHRRMQHQSVDSSR